MLNGDFGRKANELGIPVEDVTLLIYAQSMHGYVPSINIEIAK